MNPSIEQYIAEALPMVASAAIAWGVAGFALGCVLGGALALLLGWFGVWALPEGRSLWWRRVCLTLFVGGTGLSGGFLGGSVGFYQGVFSAAREAPQAKAMLTRMSHAGARAGATFLVRVGASGKVHPAEGSPVLSGTMEGVLAGTDEVAVADIRAAFAAYGRIVTSGDDPVWVMETADVVSKAVGEVEGSLVRNGIDRANTVLAEGGDVRALDATLGTSWRALDAVAAQGGKPDALSLEEFETLFVDYIVVPMTLRPVVVTIVPFVLAALAVLPAAWLVPLFLMWLLRRRTLSPADDSVEGVHAIR